MIQQKKQTKKNRKKKTPTEKIRTWLDEFVTKPNPVFGNLPPCPFARKAILDNKVHFIEMPPITTYSTLYQFICEADFEEIDVLCMIIEPDRLTAKETVELAHDLNQYFMSKDVVVLEDHPDIDERVKDVRLNNGEYILFLVQSLSKLNKFLYNFLSVLHSVPVHHSKPFHDALYSELFS